jgi:hypothetical protein
MSLAHTLKSVIGNAEDTIRRVGISDGQKEKIAFEREKLRALGDTQVEKAIILMSQMAAMAVSAQGEAVDIKLTK